MGSTTVARCDPMPGMPPVSHNILSLVHGWQEQQQPLVRALSAPMVDDVTEALDGVQEVVDGQEAALALQGRQLGELVARMESME